VIAKTWRSFSPESPLPNGLRSLMNRGFSDELVEIPDRLVGANFCVAKREKKTR